MVNISEVREGSEPGSEPRLPFRRVGDRLLEAALDGVPLAVDRLDVARPDLFLEEGVGHLHGRFGAGEEEPE